MTDIEKIGSYALMLGVAIITMTVVTMILGNFVDVSYATNSYNKTFDNSTTVYYQRGVQSMDVYNTTNQLYPKLPATNYSYTAANGTLLIIDANAGRYGTEAVWWSVKEDSNATNVITKGAQAMMNYSDWFPIIVIIIVAVLILALVSSIGNRSGV